MLGSYPDPSILNDLFNVQKPTKGDNNHASYSPGLVRVSSPTLASSMKGINWFCDVCFASKNDSRLVMDRHIMYSAVLLK